MSNENLPGLEEFIKDSFKDIEGEKVVFSSINEDGLIQVTLYFWQDGQKNRIDFVMVGHLIGVGLATEAFNQDVYDKVKTRVFSN